MANYRTAAGFGVVVMTHQPAAQNTPNYQTASESGPHILSYTFGPTFTLITVRRQNSRGWVITREGPEIERTRSATNWESSIAFLKQSLLLEHDQPNSHN